MMELTALKQAEVGQYWPEAEQYLLTAVHASEDDPAAFMRQVKARVFAGINTLWVLRDEKTISAYAITILYSPDGVVNIAQIALAHAKDLEILLAQMDVFVTWAIGKKLDYIEVIGRKGWEKTLKPLGFRHNYTSLLRRITEELH